MDTFKMSDFGAHTDNSKINTSNIQKAIDTCNKNGGGSVICDNGSIKTGTLIIKSNVELCIEAGSKIIGSENLEDYKDLVAPGFKPGEGIEKSTNALILASFAENISITGKGEINGSGLSFYDHKTADANGKFAKPETQRPRIIMFYRCKNVLIEDVSFVDSACWTIWLMQCENVCIHRIKISGDKKMRNIDGIDIDACCNVTVSDCIIDTEDDCIAIRSMKNLYDKVSVCENITLTNCTLKTQCNGIRVGCSGDGEIKNCVFSNIVISESTNGIIFQNPKYYLPDGITIGPDIHDILFDNIIIKCFRYPVWLFIEDGIKLKQLSDLTFSNIKISYCGGPLLIQGSKETSISDIRFTNVQINTGGEDAILCQRCRNIKFDNLDIVGV